MRASLWLVTTLTALVLVPCATASGPYLGVLRGGGGVSDPGAGVRYVALPAAPTTVVAAVRTSDGRVLRYRSLTGDWGAPYVTLDRGVGGLSADGRVLVLADGTAPRAALRARSQFTVLAAKPLRVERTIALHGDFGFDALSPDGRLLYLIEHVSAADITSYRVRAYDLAAGRLLPQVIADKRQRDWVMTGFPVARATSDGGRWVYTLYDQGDNYPFVHALDTMKRTAVCIGLPWSWTENQDAINSARLTLGDDGRLVIAGDHGHGPTFVLDTRTFKVSKGRSA